MSDQSAVRPRSEVPAEHKWNAESVFETPQAWQEAFEALAADVPTIEAYKGRLGEGPGTLVEWFETLDGLMRRFGKLYVYALMSYFTDLGDQQAAAMAGQARGLMGQVLGATAFMDPEILAIGQDTIQQWAADDPRLETYDHYFDDLFRTQAHVRSAEVEELLGKAQAPFGMLQASSETLANSDLPIPPAQTSTGEVRQVTQGTIGKHLHSPDRTLRRTAYESYASAYRDFINTFASLYTGSVQKDVFVAQAHQFDTALEAALHPSNLPVEVFHNLVDTFQSHLPMWHRYWAVKRKALGVEKLYPYDIWAPLRADHPEVSYEQAVEWVAAGVGPLGPDYVNVLRRGALEQRWVDVYPNQGKRQGAFSFGQPGTYPFINMNFGNDVSGMSTLAHEFGHSMHSYFTWETQPSIYARYSMFVAEVASNFNQALVRAYLLESSDDEALQVALLEEAMDNFHRYFFIMPTLARFELEAHTRVEQGQPLSAEVLNELCADLFAEGYGDEVSYDREDIGVTWAQFSHLYVAYYTFQYATGISGAHALAARILREEPGAVEAYLGFLRSGSNGYPLDVLREAGVDLTTPRPVEEAFGVMEGYIDRLEELTAR